MYAGSSRARVIDALVEVGEEHIALARSAQQPLEHGADVVVPKVLGETDLLIAPTSQALPKGYLVDRMPRIELRLKLEVRLLLAKPSVTFRAIKLWRTKPRCRHVCKRKGGAHTVVLRSGDNEEIRLTNIRCGGEFVTQPHSRVHLQPEARNRCANRKGHRFEVDRLANSNILDIGVRFFDALELRLGWGGGGSGGVSKGST